MKCPKCHSDNPDSEYEIEFWWIQYQKLGVKNRLQITQLIRKYLQNEEGL